MTSLNVLSIKRNAMTIYRYFKAGRKAKTKGLRLDRDSILKAISQRMLKDYNLATAMEKLKWEGLLDLQEERIDGLGRMLKQIRELKADLLKTYNLNHVLDKTKDYIRSVCEDELETIRPQTAEDIHLEQDGNILQPLEDRIKELYDKLETDFPKNLVRVVQKIIRIFPERSVGKEKLFHICEDLWRKTSGLDIIVQEGYTIDYQELIIALAELKNIIEASNDEIRAGFVSLMARYSHVFNFERGLKDWIEKIQKKRAALRLLLLSLSYPVRIGLEGFVGFSSEMDHLAQSLQELWVTLDKISPHPSNIKGYHFSGKRILDLDSAFVLAEKIYKLEQLEGAILRANLQGNLSDINTDLLREILGELAESSIQKLSQMVDVLIEEGYLTETEGRYRLTSKALRRIGELALSDIFSNFHWSRSNSLATRKNRSVHFTGGIKEYEYGDVLNLHLSSTLFNALRRNPTNHPPVSINPLDFEVYEPEHISQNSTVLLIDMSSSMSDKFPKAKKVALALKQLVCHYFPGDSMKIVGFYTLARPVNMDELIELRTIPFYTGHVPRMIEYQELRERERKGGLDFPGDFTNIQEGLRISRELLLRDRNEEKHIFLITDGEPTACIKEGIVYLECPPTSDIFDETLREVTRCTRCGIRITTFMLSEDKSLEEFVKALEKINKGKAFFTPPEEIDHYVVIDYLKKKSYQIM